MSLLLMGILLWALVHFLPVFAPTARQNFVDKIGLIPYRGLFSAILVGAMALMVFGWQQYPEEYYYPQMTGAREVTFLLLFFAINFFVAAKMQCNINRRIRHPQLTAVTIWALAHLISNGEAKAVLLFSGLLIWAFIMRVGINRRDSDWVKPEKVGAGQEIKVATITLIIYTILLFSHTYFTGTALV